MMRMISSPIHNCIQVSLENDYFRQKLTEYYKQNKLLKEQLSVATAAAAVGNKSLSSATDGYERKATAVSDNSCQTDNLPDSIAPSSKPKTSSSDEPQISTAQVCNNNKCKSKIPVRSQPAILLHTTKAAIDKDFYNKQNKV